MQVKVASFGAKMEGYELTKKRGNSYLDIPSKRSKLLSLLQDSMEEAETKDYLSPLHSKNCYNKSIINKNTIVIPQTAEDPIIMQNKK